MRLTLNRIVALAAIAAAGLMAGCSADSPGPTGTPPPKTGGNLTLVLVASDANPKAGSCTLIQASASQNGAPVPEGTSIQLSAVGAAFGQNGLQTISLVSTGGSVTTALCSNTEGASTVKGTVTVGSATAHGQTGVVFGPNGVPTGPFISVCASPHTGSVSGGTAVTISGGGFGTTAANVRVLFREGNVVHQGVVTGVTDNTINVTTPAFPELAGLPATPVEVDVLLNGQTLASAACFTYVTDTQPIVTAILPSSGTKVGGTRVSIIGSGFSAPVQVFFGGTLEAQIVSVSPTQIVAITPPANAQGPQQSFPQNVSVTVKEVNCSGPACTSGPVTFTYTVGLSIFTVTPDHGDATTSVTITGEGFIAPVTVAFGGKQGTVVSVTGTQIVAKPPAGCGVSGPITVTLQATGESATSATDFVESGPTITSGPNPNTGPSNVSTTVTLTGTNLFTSGNTSGVSVVNVTGGAATVASASEINGIQTVTLHVTPNCSSSTMTFALQNAQTGCTTSTITFNVTGGTAVSGQTPSTPLPVGTQTAATVTGTGLFPTGNFAGASVTNVTGGTVTITGGTENGTTQTLNLAITPSGTACAAASSVSFQIQNTQTGCSSGQVTFSVAGAGITVAAPSPASGPTGVTTAVTVTGSGLFPTGNSTAVSVVGVTGGTVAITGASETADSQSVTLNITPNLNGCLSQDVQFALQNTVTGCTSQTLTFHGTSGAPTVSTETPSTGPNGSLTPVVITGTNFFPTGNPGAVSITNVSGGTVALTGTSESGSNQTLNLNITPSASCAPTNVTFTIHNAVTGCDSTTVTFSGTGGSPTVTSGPTPNGGPAGTTTHVTVSGTGFFPTGNPAAATIVNISGGTVSIVNATQSGSTDTLDLFITPDVCAPFVTFQIQNTAGGCTSSQIVFSNTSFKALQASFSQTAGAPGSMQITFTNTTTGGVLPETCQWTAGGNNAGSPAFVLGSPTSCNPVTVQWDCNATTPCTTTPFIELRVTDSCGTISDTGAVGVTPP